MQPGDYCDIIVGVKLPDLNDPTVCPQDRLTNNDMGYFVHLLKGCANKWADELRSMGIEITLVRTNVMSAERTK